jgi:hypothetical protein
MFGDDETNISFYADNYEAMKDSNVTIMLENVERQNIRNNKITVFNIPECCARFYWKKFYPTKSEKIAIIGFGKVGQNILTFGLQMNIISPDQHFEYHIWGNSEEFVSLHTQLDKMQPDEVIFHHDKWYKETEKISECDRVILCAAENNNLEVLSKLFAAGRCRNNVYIYAPNEKIVETMFGSDNNVFCFGNASEVASTDVIINENTLAEAKAQHSFYVEKYGASPWEELDSFTRYSNISSSDFDYVLRRLYHEEKVPLETLAHLEHIRWCRYYYLNNWRYGSVRNNAERVHTCLIPYEELSDEEKLKDFESIKVKL